MGMPKDNKNKQSHSWKSIATYRYPINDQRKRVRFWRLGFKINTARYLEKKPNQNLLISGATGQGKSKLMRLMIESMPNPKTIFSYKENDEYLQIEGNFIAAEQNLPNPFLDAEAFTDAFAVAFNIQSEGIQASTAVSLVNTLAKESRSWPDFISNAKRHSSKTRDINVRSAVNYLLEKIKSLTYDSQQLELDLDKTNILDMSMLNDDAKTFYSELFLRQIYKKVKQRKHGSPKVIICVDEAHRLTRNMSSRRQSIINEMSREIRAFGMLWTATQNLSDIPDQLRNQFGTQFAFSTTSEADLRALSQIDRDLANCTSGLKNHEFIDAKQDKVHAKIDIFKAKIGSLKERDLSNLRANKTAHAPLALDKLADRPTPTLHAAMLAIYDNPDAELKELAKYLKKKGWVTSDPTIYGSKDRKGVLSSLISLGYATKDGSRYTLTDKALWWIDPHTMLKRAKNTGSDLHKQLMRKTIDKLHEENMLVLIPEGTYVPDLIAYPMSKGDKKYLWEDKNRKAYEIQTTARKDSILANSDKKHKYNLPIIWVTYDKSILEEIKEITEDKDTYILIRC